MTTSIVIPAYNGQHFLAKNLPSVLKLHANEIIVVDDASTDNTREFLRQNYSSQVKLVTHAKNTRFPISVNDGFAAATGDVVFLLNQDVQPDSQLISSVINHFKVKDIFAVTFNEQNRSWATAKLVNGFIEFGNGRLDNKVHSSLWASGGSAAFRKTYWDELGGFDPIFTPGYYEDFDLGLRAWKRGYHIVWEPKAKVVHTPESTFSQTFSPKYLVRIKERNYILAHWRNLDSENLLPNLMAIFTRATANPGFLFPSYMALAKIIPALNFRKKEKKHWVKTDAQVFDNF